VTAYRLVAQPRADLDVAAAGLGREFLEESRDAYDRIGEDPLRYRQLESGIRRALLRRFPYAIYFAVESDVVVVLAVLHVSRNPAEWQLRRRT
jgi:plasmid stabilization system protein ParE